MDNKKVRKGFKRKKIKPNESGHFVIGHSTNSNDSNIELSDYKNNYIYKQFLEARNWHDYYQDLKLNQRIDELILSSPYAEVYKKLDAISNDDAIGIYIMLKDKLVREFILDSYVYIFTITMEILGKNLNTILSYLPIDEKAKLLKELEANNQRESKVNLNKLF